jgi:hypothetical protein
MPEVGGDFLLPGLATLALAQAAIIFALSRSVKKMEGP